MYGPVRGEMMKSSIYFLFLLFYVMQLNMCEALLMSRVKGLPQKVMSLLESQNKEIDLLYDSECPICAMEVDFLKKRDVNQRIRFTDLSGDDYKPENHGNVNYSQGMRKIHAVLPDGKVVAGVDVFRHTYKAIGLGWMFAITKLPVIGNVADRMYDMWAENRLRITGRGDLADKLKERATQLKDTTTDSCDSDACELFD